MGGGEASKAFFINEGQSRTCESIENVKQIQRSSFHQMRSKKMNRRNPAALPA